MKGYVWEKKGRIFNPTAHTQDWMSEYAQNPNVLVLEDRLRIYFTTRPKRGSDGNCVSVTTYADFEKKEPFNLISPSLQPVLPLGGPGDFDEFGIMPGSVIRVPERNEVWLYYVGWTRLTTVPYKWSVGLATSNDGGKTFSRYSKGPILGPSAEDPYLQACPRVIRKPDGSFYMWYNAGTGWNFKDNHYESVYITQTATSPNGIDWHLTGESPVPSVVEDECQTSASYLQFDQKHHLYFSYRFGIDFRTKARGYRIGYACSTDGHAWVRDDQAVGIDVATSGWDEEMICYPHVVTIDGVVFMFYCGNEFGREGFGYARLSKID